MKNPQLGVKKGESEGMKMLVVTLIVSLVFWTVIGVLLWRALSI